VHDPVTEHDGLPGLDDLHKTATFRRADVFDPREREVRVEQPFFVMAGEGGCLLLDPSLERFKVLRVASYSEPDDLGGLEFREAAELLQTQVDGALSGTGALQRSRQSPKGGFRHVAEEFQCEVDLLGRRPPDSRDVSLVAESILQGAYSQAQVIREIRRDKRADRFGFWLVTHHDYPRTSDGHMQTELELIHRRTTAQVHRLAPGLESKKCLKKA
jgi:hypothetical protein